MTDSVENTEEKMLAPAQPTARVRAREIVAVAAILLTLVLVALAALWPWRANGASASPSLNRYAPTADGYSTLSAKQAANGKTLLWQSVNRAHLQNAAAYATELTPAQRKAVESLYAADGRAPDADFVALVADSQLIRERVTELDAQGVYTETLNLRLRNARGEFIVSLNAARPGQELIFTPPLPVLPAELRAGARWEGAGQIGAQATYTITGEVADADPYRGPLGEMDDCLQARFRFVITLGGQPLDDRRWTDTYCAGVGMTQEDEVSAVTGAVTRWITLAASGANGAAEALAALPPMPAAPEPPSVAPREEWQLTRAGRYSSGIDTAATIAPLFLPNPPALLVASHDGDLIALDVSTGFTDPIWRFSPGGTVYGQPAIDSQAGRIYFGASDKRLYALDSRGLFLWSFLTGDNVATQPLVFEDLVIFGSEDRSVYAVESGSGKLRWRRETGGAVVSSPALAPIEGGKALVIIGSDDGAAHGLDARTGEPIWTYETGKPVEAPVTVANGVALITSTAGAVTALDPASGMELWTADNSSRAIRFAPAVAADRLVVVDQQGYLSAYSLADGRRLWQSLEFDYLGAPLLVGDRLYVAASYAAVYEVSLDGARLNTWRMAEASDAPDTNPRLDFGPVAGGGAIWTVDSRSVLRRIGAPATGPARLKVEWVRQVNEPPFAMDLLAATCCAVSDWATVMDEGGRVFRVYRATGKTELQFQSNIRGVRLEPLSTYDLIVFVTPSGLTAVDETGAVAWQAEGGVTLRPPIDGVFWTSALPDESGVRIQQLSSLSGEVGWAHEYPGIAIPGGLAISGGTVFASAPVMAFHAPSGEMMWKAPELTGGIGSPAVSEDGKTVYVGRVDPASGGEVVALNAEDGAIRWRAPLGRQSLSMLDQPWASGRVVVVPTLSGSALGLDAESGALRWQADLPAPRFGNITVEEGRVYMALTDGQMIALSAETGAIVRRGGDREGGLEGYAFAQRPIVVSERVLMNWGSAVRGYVPAASP